MAAAFAVLGSRRRRTPSPRPDGARLRERVARSADEAFYAGAGATLAAPSGGESFCGVSGFMAVAPLECGTVVRPGHDSEQGLRIDSGGVFEIRFAAKQANVSLWVATSGTGSSYDVTVEAWPGEPGVGTRIDPGSAVTDAARLARPPS